MKNRAWIILLALTGFLPAWVNAATATHYIVKGGEVYDKSTNMTWQRCSLGKNWKGNTGCVGTIKTFKFDDAIQQATDKWHVPTKDELATLIDHNRAEFPTIDATVFPDMDVNYPTYWSSTPNGDNRAWNVRFSTGSTADDMRGYQFAVRLVRSGQ